jgi:hypothetical protein
VLVAAAARAQSPGAASAAEIRRVDGVVMHGEAKGPRPISGVRVVLHRVGSDRAGPLDSAITDARGRYRFRFSTSGCPDAIYFVSASYDGIAYFSVPLRERETAGDDAQITVFDTTSGPVPIHVVGHHVIVGSPDAQGDREAVEVFELQNDSSVTRVSGSRVQPVWATTLPRGAANTKINPSGDISPNAVSFTDNRVRLFAPISPGARQLSYAYQLRRDALPLSIALDTPTGVLEVLTEESRATVTGANLTEVAPTSTGGRTFRRFLAQNVPAQSVVRIDVPFAIGESRVRWFIAVAVVCGLGMLGAIAVAQRRRRVVTVAATPAPRSETEDLLQTIATLDAAFERNADPTADERGRYDSERARLKARLAEALAAEGRTG